jgi:hypothetical protein
MSNVVRFPGQHREKPHCTNCEREVPTLTGLEVTVPKGFPEILNIGIEIVCECGAHLHISGAAIKS